MRCPQCGEEAVAADWNCSSCRVNLHWATEHYEELAEIRVERGLQPRPSSPSFLINAHRGAMEDRARRGSIERKIRIAPRSDRPSGSGGGRRLPGGDPP